MTLKEKLIEDMKQAQKNRDTLALSVFRMIRASIKNKEIEIGKLLEDNQVTGIISSAIKQRRDSKEQFHKGGRQDLADKEGKEIDILMAYMPDQAGEDEIEEKARKAIAKIGASSLKDMGKVIRKLITEFKGRADGSVINRIVKKNA